MEVLQTLAIKLRIDKNNKSFFLDIPNGCPWEELENTIEEFRLAVAEMKKQQQAAIQQEVIEQVDVAIEEQASN